MLKNELYYITVTSSVEVMLLVTYHLIDTSFKLPSKVWGFRYDFFLCLSWGKLSLWAERLRSLYPQRLVSPADLEWACQCSEGPSSWPVVPAECRRVWLCKSGLPLPPPLPKRTGQTGTLHLVCPMFSCISLVVGWHNLDVQHTSV